MSTSGDVGYGVGPVLHATPFAWSVISVIEEENTDVRVQDEGAYLRVLVPRVCRLSRAGLEAATGSAIRFLNNDAARNCSLGSALIKPVSATSHSRSAAV